MKNWKIVVLTVVAIVLVALLMALLTATVQNRWETRVIRSRIKQYEMVKQEQQLITDILNLRYEAAMIQAKFNPAEVKE